LLISRREWASNWIQNVKCCFPSGDSANNLSNMSMPTTSTMLALELVISDHNKSLLLANAQFIPYL
jgi:hypothetical protein